MNIVEYLIVMHKKAMEKPAIEVIGETCRKEREENRVRKFTNYFIIDERTFQCVIIKNARVDFEYNWFVTIVKEVMSQP